MQKRVIAHTQSALVTGVYRRSIRSSVC